MKSITGSRVAAFIMVLACVVGLSCTAEPQVQSDVAVNAGKEESAKPVAVIATAAQPPRKQGEDWPAFLGPRGDGTSAETGVDPARWDPHPPIVWTMPLGTSYGGPTIARGRLFVFDRLGNDERVTCYSATSGEEIWQWKSRVEYDDMYGYNNGPRCSPVIDGEHVYAYGVAGQLSCIKFETGELVWTKDLLRDFGVIQNFFGVASTPFVYQNLLLVMVGGSPPSSQLQGARLDLVKPNGTAVVAFDKATGDEVYRLGNDLASYASMTVREIESKPTGLAFCRSGLIAFDPETGQQRFEFPWRADMLESVNAALPVTDGNRILLSETYEVGSVFLEVKDDTPTKIWQDEGAQRNHAFRAHWSTPCLIDGHLYGCSGRNQPDSDFRCVRLSDGEVQWFDRRHERSSVLAIDGYLIVLGEYGNLELLKPNPEKLEVIAEVDLSEIADPSDGSPLLDYPCWAAPIVSHGLLYVRGNNRLICFDLIPAK